MAQEEHILGYCYSSGGGGGGGGGSGGGGDGSGGGGGGGGGSGCSSSSRSKKIKQKKVPQRGLGVAQLEKIRLEEIQKKDSLNAANVIRPVLPPFQNSVPTNLPSLSSQNIEIQPTNFVLNSKQLNAGGGEIAWPRLWNGEYNLTGEKQNIDHHGFAFESGLPLQRSYQFQQLSPSSSSSMLHQVNSSSGISPPSELSSRMEPPSNQSFRGNNYATLWTEEDKMVGMKRSYPFSLESPSAPSLQCNYHPSYAASISKSNELASCSNVYTPHMEPRNKCIREGPSNSISPPPSRNQNRVTRDMLNGDFLTLAPPTVSSQDYVDNRIHQAGPSEASSVQQSFSFFPIMPRTNQTTTQEQGETIDLSLKL